MNTKTMTRVQRWMDEAREMPVSNQLNVPIAVLLMEAMQVSACVKKYWEPGMASDGNTARGGLKNANPPGEDRLNRKIADEILELQQLVMQTHVQAVLAVKPRGDASPLERGRFLLGEISGALAYLFDDGVEDEKDTQLEALDAQFGATSASAVEVAPALFAYATLANDHREGLDGLGMFDAALIDEAFTVVAAIYARPGQTAVDAEGDQALGRRNKLVALLRARVGQVRKIARFVFRAQPEIIREFTSGYMRRQNKQRRNKSRKPVAEKAV